MNHKRILAVNNEPMNLKIIAPFSPDSASGMNGRVIGHTHLSVDRFTFDVQAVE